MTDNSTLGIFAFSAPVRGAYLTLDQPRTYKKNGKDVGEPKFDGTFFFPQDHPDFAGLKAKVVAVAKAKWPNVDLKTLQLPFAAGDKVADRADKKAKEKGKDGGRNDFFRGNVVLKAKSKFRPRLGAMVNGRAVDYEDEAVIVANKSKFYSGVDCLVEVNFVAYEGDNGDQGVTAYLNAVFSLNKGDKLAIGGGPSASERFSGYVGHTTDEDPTGGAGLDDDDIAF